MGFYASCKRQHFHIFGKLKLDLFILLCLSFNIDFSIEQMFLSIESVQNDDLEQPIAKGGKIFIFTVTTI